MKFFVSRGKKLNKGFVSYGRNFDINIRGAAVQLNFNLALGGLFK
jgi:hypothetical protein